MQDLYRKHKLKLAMLAPLVLGLLFFLFSTLLAFFALGDAKLPKNFDAIKIDASKFSIKQIDPKTNLPKWVLNADRTEASNDQASAKIYLPQMIFYSTNGLEKFRIKAKIANLDKIKQNVELEGEVLLTSSDGKYQISAGKMFVDNDSDSIKYSDNWQIKNSDGYQILGDTGKVNRDLTEIISEGKAQLIKQDSNINLSAQEIKLKLNDESIVEARNSAKLQPSTNTTLLAGFIQIHKDGSIYANSNVVIYTPKITCQSGQMRLVPKANKQPHLAIFQSNPKLTQNKQVIYADLVKYDFDTEAVEFEGHIRSN